MRVLILTNYFPPEIGAASHLFYDLAESLGEHGHRVTVVTGFPRYMLRTQRQSGLYRREVMGRSEVVRVASSPFDQGGPIRRGLDHVYLAGSLFAGGLLAGRHDVVFMYSPPLTTGMAGWALRRLRGMPFVVNVQDLFPQSPIDLGLMKDPRLIRAFEALERLVYRTADALTVHSEGNRQHVVSKGCRPDKVRVVPNWVDTEFIQPGPRDNIFRRESGLGDCFVVQFAGVMGYSQDLDTVVEAAALLRDQSSVAFQLVGDGVERPRLEEKARALGLTNVMFTALQPRERYPMTVRASDACLVTLHKEVRTPVVPSKLLSVMAAGKPVLMSVDLSGDAPAIVRAADSGICVSPGQPAQLAEAVLSLKRDPVSAARMGANGRRYVERHFSKCACVAQYEALFRSLQTNHQPEPRPAAGISP